MASTTRGCYERIERGLCQGLNERLDMPPTFARRAGQSLHPDAGGLQPAGGRANKAENPDVVYYRRKFASGAGGAAVRSVVVPFSLGLPRGRAIHQQDRGPRRMAGPATVTAGQVRHQGRRAVRQCHHQPAGHEGPGVSTANVRFHLAGLVRHHDPSAAFRRQGASTWSLRPCLPWPC